VTESNLDAAATVAAADSGTAARVTSGRTWWTAIIYLAAAVHTDHEHENHEHEAGAHATA